MLRNRRNLLLLSSGVAWVACVAYGTGQLWEYDAAAGPIARPPAVWPTTAPVVGRAYQPALVLLIHPHCPCSRATLTELAKIMARCDGRVTTTVFVLRPHDAPAGWERTSIWDAAAEIPGVSVVADLDGARAKQLGAFTSGQTLLFAADRTLLFSGGITESRGHSGDNAGRATVESLILRPPADNAAGVRVAHTPAYGCELFDRGQSAAAPFGDFSWTP